MLGCRERGLRLRVQFFDFAFVRVCLHLLAFARVCLRYGVLFGEPEIGVVWFCARVCLRLQTPAFNTAHLRHPAYGGRTRQRTLQKHFRIPPKELLVC